MPVSQNNSTIEPAAIEAIHRSRFVFVMIKFAEDGSKLGIPFENAPIWRGGVICVVLREISGFTSLTGDFYTSRMERVRSDANFALMQWSVDPSMQNQIDP